MKVDRQMLKYCSERAESHVRKVGSPTMCKNLIIKTKASLLPEVIELVKGVHSYTVPEVIVLPIIAGSQDYLNWLDDEVKEH